MTTKFIKKTIQAVVPLYINSPSLYPIVTDFFESMEEHYPDIELIVIDDCSPLPHDFPVTHKNKKNLGFTGTVNKGLKLSTADVILVLNDDLKIAKGDLDRYYLLDGLGIWSPRDTASDDSDRFGAIWGLTRETLNRLGFMNDKYKNYFSDNDYYQRAKKLNIQVVKWRDICVEHRENATFKNEDKEKLFETDQKTFLS